MSIKMFREIEKLKGSLKTLAGRVDKMAKDIHSVTQSVVAMERADRTISDDTVVPRVALPKSLEGLEIGKQPVGGLDDGSTERTA
jgi:hypothetical protein